MKREFKTTEFWFVILALAAWFYDKHNGTDYFSKITPENIADIHSQVLAIAAAYKQQAGTDSSLLLYLSMAVYGLKKWEKVKQGQSEQVTAP